MHLRTVSLHSLKRRKACMYETRHNECSSYKPGAVSRLSFTQCLPARGKIQIRSPLSSELLLSQRGHLSQRIRLSDHQPWRDSQCENQLLQSLLMRLKPTASVSTRLLCLLPGQSQSSGGAGDFFMSLLLSCLLHLLRNLALLQTETLYLLHRRAVWTALL